MPESVPETTPAPLTITLFGPMQILVGGKALPRLHSRKDLWLLALLALRRGRPVEREWLAGTLWPDADQDQALANLRPVLSNLRRALGAEGVRLQSPGRHTLCMDLTGVDVDVLTFDAAVSDGRLPALARAAELYTGPLLEGCAEEWVPQERGAREEDCLRALGTLADAALAAGDYKTACVHYRRAVVLDPWREEARRGLMDALARAGDVNAAFQVYREFVQLLRDDPRAAPDEQTSALYARLRAEARQSAVPPRTPAAPIAPVSAIAGHLPQPLTELVGREDERLEVAARLRRSRLVTLTGPGGIGKTRLALEVGAETGPGFSDGVWLVTLESLTEGSQVDRQIAGVIGLKEAPGLSLREGLVGHLRSRRMLLVLDNCEHLLETSAQITGHLLRECAGVRVLATSREALGVTGEVVWPVPALAVPDLTRLPAEPAALVPALLNCTSVRLFVERAQAVQATFSLTEGSALAVAQVCARLEGMPLAIELAAARITVMTVAQIAARLDDRLGLLTGGNRGGQPRQQTLRATLDWSYSLLGEPARRLLARLSVFVGGWTLEAAEQVCAGHGLPAGRVLDLLKSLVDQSLVAFGERTTGAQEAGARYRLLETVRQYAAELLEGSGEAARIRARHRDHFLALAEEAEPQLTGVEVGTWLARLEAEWANLRAALDWCAEEPAGAEAGMRLAGALGRFWEGHGEYSEGRAALGEAIRRAGAGGQTRSRAKALDAAGMLAFYQGDYDAARRLQEEGLALFRALGDLPGTAWSLHRRGNLAGARGDTALARSSHEEALALFRALKDRTGVAWSLNELGRHALARGDYEAATGLYDEGLAVFRESGDRTNLAWSLHARGKRLRDRGDVRGAWSSQEEALALFRELGNKPGAAWSLNALGKVALDLTRPDAAATSRALHEEALALFRELGSRPGIAWSLHHLGDFAREWGDYAAARALHEEALALFQDLGDRQGIPLSLNYLGKVTLDQAGFGAARPLYEEALALFRDLGDRTNIAWSLHQLGNFACAQGDRAGARAFHTESLRLLREIKDPLDTARSLTCLGHVAQAQGDPASAWASFQEGLGLFQALGNHRGVAECLAGLAGVLWDGADLPRAVRLWGVAHALRESLDDPLLLPVQDEYAAPMGQARSALGGDAFDAAWEAGRGLTWEHAVAEALEWVA